MLIDTQKPDYEFLHCAKSLSTSFSRLAMGAVNAALRGLNTTSHLLSSCHKWRRTASRMRRLRRLRTTAFPFARETVKPTRGPGLPAGCARQKAAKCAHENLDPWSYTFRKSLERRIRFFLGNGWLSAVTGLLGVADGSFIADCELVTALSPATRQDGAPVLCFHALTEPMNLGSLAIVRLKRTFWHV